MESKTLFSSGESASEDDTGITKIESNTMMKELRERAIRLRYGYGARLRSPNSRLSTEEILCHELYRCILSEDKAGFESIINTINLKRFEMTKWTPLMTCVQKQSFALTKRLLQCGVSVHTRDPKKRVVLHVACRSGWINIAKLLLTHTYGYSYGYSNSNNNWNRSYLNVLDNLNNTPLFEACKRGHCELIKFVLLNKHLHSQICDINTQNFHGQTALHIACEKGYYEIARQLVNYKEMSCIMNIVDNKGHTPLQRAVRRHRYEIVKLLLNVGYTVMKHRNCKKRFKKYHSKSNSKTNSKHNSPNKYCKSPKRHCHHHSRNCNHNNNDNDDSSDSLPMCFGELCHKRNNNNNGNNGGMSSLLLVGDGGHNNNNNNKRNECDAIGINMRSDNGMTCLMIAAKTRDEEMLELLLFNRYVGVLNHAFWLETDENKHNVLYYLKKSKCNKKYINHIAQSLQVMLHSCLVSEYINPPLPDAIAELIATITY